MQPFDKLSAIAVPIDIPNCDTDQIIPARFLRRAKDDPTYARFLLHDLRFQADGSETDFIFNQAIYSDAQILVCDINWGCGSSREAAVNALITNHIRAVIAPTFGDIHYSNCIKNGVLPVRLSAANCNLIRIQLHESPGASLAIDLEKQTVSGPDRKGYMFDIDPMDKIRLLHGLDDISMTLEHQAEIEAFERDYRKKFRWIF
mgnify:FL=1